MSDNTKKSKVHYDLRKIETYIRTQEYPADVDTKGKKANYRRAAKKFNVVNGLFCKDDRIVIIEKMFNWILFVMYIKVWEMMLEQRPCLVIQVE